MNIHGGDIYSYGEKTGRMPLDFSANINPFGLPQGVKKAVADSIDACLHYPDIHCRALQKAVSVWEDVPKDFLFFGNGAADIIFRLALSLRPKAALVPAPTFHEYEAALQSVGCPVSYYPLKPESDFALDAAVLAHIPQDGVVFLCNPNNPTGMLTPGSLIGQIAKACRATHTVLVVDECFLDFAENPGAYSAKALLQEYPNLVILKAFTKLFAMPGLRLGYCLCSSSRLIGGLARVGQPWAVSVPAQAAGVAACKEEAFVKESVLYVRAQREFLAQGLKALGLPVFPGSANYILFRGPENLQLLLEEEGILIRSCANYRGLDPSYFRTAVKLHSENKKLLAAIQTVCIQ